jgi:hypothetical protein
MRNMDEPGKKTEVFSTTWLSMPGTTDEIPMTSGFLPLQDEGRKKPSGMSEGKWMKSVSFRPLKYPAFILLFPISTASVSI